MAKATKQTEPVLKAICGAEDRPLRIGDVEPRGAVGRFLGYGST